MGGGVVHAAAPCSEGREPRARPGRPRAPGLAENHAVADQLHLMLRGDGVVASRPPRASAQDQHPGQDRVWAHPGRHQGVQPAGLHHRLLRELQAACCGRRGACTRRAVRRPGALPRQQQEQAPPTPPTHPDPCCCPAGAQMTSDITNANHDQDEVRRGSAALRMRRTPAGRGVAQPQHSASWVSPAAQLCRSIVLDRACPADRYRVPKLVPGRQAHRHLAQLVHQRPDGRPRAHLRAPGCRFGLQVSWARRVRLLPAARPPGRSGCHACMRAGRLTRWPCR